MYFETDWKDDPKFTYLGSEQNPETDMKYDYWLVMTGNVAKKEDEHYEHSYVGRHRIEMNYSYTCRHGMEPHEYGSSLISNCAKDAKSFIEMGKHYSSDFIFGLMRAQFFCIWYLATGNKPLLDREEECRL